LLLRIFFKKYMDTTHNPIGVLCCRALQRDSQSLRPNVQVTIGPLSSILNTIKKFLHVKIPSLLLYCTVMLLLRIFFKKYMDTTHNPIGVLCCRALQRDSQSLWPNEQVTIGPLSSILNTIKKFLHVKNTFFVTVLYCNVVTENLF
jgi:hypothetical protein